MAVGEAFVEIGVDFASLRRNLSKAKGEFAVKVRQIEGNAAKSGKRIGQSLGRGLKTGLKAATVGLGALVVAGGLAVKTFMQGQRESVRIAKTLKATGNAAGFTAEQLDTMARKMQDATVIDDKQIKRAQNALLSFTNITEDQFKRSVRAAADLSAMFGKDIHENAMRLGRALADPMRGLEGMRETGIIMTKQQEDMIKTMWKLGKTAEAQNEIFNLLRTNGIDGNADATAALTDQWELSKSVLEDIVSDLGEAIAGMFGLTDGSTKLSDAFKTVRDSIKEVIDTGFFKDLGVVIMPILKHVAKLTVMIAGGLAMMAAAANALLSGKGFVAMDRQIIAIDASMKKVILSINRMGMKTKKAGDDAKKDGKNQIDANKKLKAGIEARIKKLKENLAFSKRLLKWEEDRLKNMQKVKKQLQEISNIQTVGLEDRFTQRSTQAVAGQKKTLQDMVDADIRSQKAAIQESKKDIKDIEGKLRAEGVMKAAAQQIKNQEIQIELQKESNKLQKQKGTGSVFSNE